MEMGLGAVWSDTYHEISTCSFSYGDEKPRC